jgi:archaemetzincin
MIMLIPIERLPEDILADLISPLSGLLHQEARIGAPIELPPESWNTQRRQYSADVILDMMLSPGIGDHHLAVADTDIFTPGLNYVFGEADSITKKAVISLARLRPEYYSLPADHLQLKERTLKEAVHELGHTWGLRHCPNTSCVMHFSNSLQDTDKKNHTFCPICRMKFTGLY